MQFVAGPARALAEVDAIAEPLHNYRLFHGTRAQLLRALNWSNEAHAADGRALALASNPAQRALIEQRLALSRIRRLLAEGS